MLVQFRSGRHTYSYSPKTFWGRRIYRNPDVLSVTFWPSLDECEVWAGRVRPPGIDGGPVKYCYCQWDETVPRVGPDGVEVCLRCGLISWHQWLKSHDERPTPVYLPACERCGGAIHPDHSSDDGRFHPQCQ